MLCSVTSFFLRRRLKRSQDDRAFCLIFPSLFELKVRCLWMEVSKIRVACRSTLKIYVQKNRALVFLCESVIAHRFFSPKREKKSFTPTQEKICFRAGFLNNERNPRTTGIQSYFLATLVCKPGPNISFFS